MAVWPVSDATRRQTPRSGIVKSSRSSVPPGGVHATSRGRPGAGPPPGGRASSGWTRPRLRRRRGRRAIGPSLSGTGSSRNAGPSGWRSRSFRELRRCRRRSLLDQPLGQPPREVAGAAPYVEPAIAALHTAGCDRRQVRAAPAAEEQRRGPIVEPRPASDDPARLAPMAAPAERTGRLGLALRRARSSFRPKLSSRHRGTAVSIAPLPATVATHTP